MVDTIEALAYEAALYFDTSDQRTIIGPYRQWLGSPFDLQCKAAIPGIVVLTIVQTSQGPEFYLHHRNRHKVATSAGSIHVLPAGEFQPSRASSPVFERELDLLKSITREYAEELLAITDALDPHSPGLDFQHDPRYAPIYRALASGLARTRVLGIGLNPLTWKPDILTVTVFEDELFHDLFPTMVVENHEGTILTDTSTPDRRGYRFIEDVVFQYVDDPLVLPSGRACLALAWKHRHLLLG